MNHPPAAESAAPPVGAAPASMGGRLAALEGAVRRSVEARRAEPPDRGPALALSRVGAERLLELGVVAAHRGDADTAADRGAHAPSGTADREADADPGSAADGGLRAPAGRAADRGTRADADGASTGEVRLGRLQRNFGLCDLDVDLLLVALLPDLDARYLRLYGYLHDDLTRDRASVGLALELCAASPGDASARERLLPGSPLVRCGLVMVEGADRPFLARSLRVPDRVTMHLLGDDRPDPALEGRLVRFAGGAGSADDASARIARSLRSGARLIHLRVGPGGDGRALAAAAFTALGSSAVVLDLGRSSDAGDPVAVATVAAREARLRDAGLVAGPVEALADHSPAAVAALADSGWPTILVGARRWDPAWATTVPLAVDPAPPDPPARIASWQRQLGDRAPAGLAESPVAAGYRLDSDQVSRAATSAVLRANHEERPLTLDDLRAGARSQNAAGLERRSFRVEPRSGWDDLVVPPEVGLQLRELCARARHRERVLDGWGMGTGSQRGRGITALLAGPSGTGKTLSAEVVAGELGLDLYVVDLSTVVDKYIGETEKNLDRIFAEADGVNGVLLFDEADALFGKRSEVRDARDRYANVEVAYLLQRMELFEGIALLTTNLRANLDDAFTRRLDAVIDLPAPDAATRRLLWDRLLRPGVPRGADLDLDFCARAFELSGGNIRSAVLTAAYLAAEAGGPVGMVELIRGVEREYRKLGRLFVASEFGPYMTVLTTSTAAASMGRESGATETGGLP